MFVITTPVGYPMERICFSALPSPVDIDPKMFMTGNMALVDTSTQ